MTPKRPTHFEDFEPGQVYELGSCRIAREEMLAFARQFDPQPFHVDEERARDTLYGGLIASGWYTISLLMRLYCDTLLVDGAAGMGSPGVDEVRWRRPVRPGDVLSGRLRVLETEPSSRRPDRGTVRLGWEATNQEGEVVLTMTSRA